MRQSPAEHAATERFGTVRKGSDDATWIVMPVGRQKRWVKLATPIRTYFPVYGGTHVQATVSGDDDRVMVFDIGGDPRSPSPSSRLVADVRGVTRVWVGGGKKGKYGHGGYHDRGFVGATLLVEVAAGRRFLHVDGRGVFAFETGGMPVTLYESHMGNNSIPDAFAVTEGAGSGRRVVYLLTERVSFAWDGRSNPYAVFYEEGRNRLPLLKKLR